ESADQVAVARAHVGHVDRGVAVDARAGLGRDPLPLGEGLVFEHVGVAAFLAEVVREGVAGPEFAEPRVLLQARLRDGGARVGLGRCAWERLAPAVARAQDRKSTRLNSSHVKISYAVFCLKKKR